MDNPAFRLEEGTVVPEKTTSNVIRDPTRLPAPKDKDLNDDVKLSYLRQVLCAVVISSGLYVIAFLIGSTSLLPKILNVHSNTTIYTSEDLKWLASGPILISIPGNFLAVYLAETYGPTFIFRGSLLLCFLLYILKAFVPTLTVLWVTRVALWIIVGMFDIICVPLIALLSEPNVRGLCGALPELTTSFGILFVFVSFTYLSPTYSVLVDAAPVLLGFIGSIFVPESPFWLIQRGKTDQAKRSIARVIGPSRKYKQEELFQEILSRYQTDDQAKSEEVNKTIPIMDQIKLLRRPKNWKPVMLSMVVFAFREFGGNNIIFFYALTIFEAANISIDVFMCTISVSIARVLSTFLSASFQDKFGRRFILIGTTVISAICLITSGLVLFFDIEVLKLLPLIGIIIFILMTGVGMGPVPFIIVGEIVPPEIKFLGTALVYSLFNFYQFVIVNVMPSIINYFSVGTIFITFSLLNFAISFTLYFILPETKCKTFSEIESLFS